ncbi:MAG: GPP34 family phosphoprotein [Verrucomicrobia bacterium]|nr:GPP34 family phosphoprotein [Verrucomicrobiota bacterium]
MIRGTFMALTFTEELLLLVLDDETGKIRPLADFAMEYALAGAQLAQMWFAGLVHIEKETVQIAQGNFGESPLEEKLLAGISKLERNDLDSTLSFLAHHASEIERNGLQQLVRKGILRECESRFLWVFATRRYPVMDGRSEEEVIQRIRQRVMDPDSTKRCHSDLILIALMDVCQLSYLVFSAHELEHYQPRIKELAQRDAIGKTMAAIVEQIRNALLDTGLIHLR